MRVPASSKAVALGAALALTLSMGAQAAHAAHAAPTAAPAAAPTPTGFALGAQAYGLTARGGDLPTLPGRVGYAGIGCTDKAGISKERQVADVDLGPLGSVEGIRSTLNTVAKGKRVAANAQSTVADVKLGGGALGALSLSAVTTKVVAAKTASGFKADTSVSALIKLKLPGLPAQTLPVPTTGDPIVIPGVLRISLGKVVERQTASGAFARSDGLVVEILATNTFVSVGSATAQIDAGAVSGLFRGKGSPEEISVAQGLIQGPPQLRGNLPCVGTGGEVRSNGVANVDLGPIDLSAVSTRVLGTQGSKTASGFTEGKIARLDLGDLTIRGIVGRANVSRTGAKVTSTVAGTRVAKISFNGENLTIPEDNVLEIPGVARLEARVVERTATGVSVSALKLTVLGGSPAAGATVLLGHAEMYIGRAG